MSGGAAHRACGHECTGTGVECECRLRWPPGWRSRHRGWSRVGHASRECQRVASPPSHVEGFLSEPSAGSVLLCLPPGRRRWASDPNIPGLHTSLSTGNPYRGINQLLLRVFAVRQNFRSRWWGTCNQIQQCGSDLFRAAINSHSFPVPLERDELPRDHVLPRGRSRPSRFAGGTFRRVRRRTGRSARKIRMDGAERLGDLKAVPGTFEDPASRRHHDNIQHGRPACAAKEQRCLSEHGSEARAGHRPRGTLVFPARHAQSAWSVPFAHLCPGHAVGLNREMEQCPAPADWAPEVLRRPNATPWPPCPVHHR